MRLVPKSSQYPTICSTLLHLYGLKQNLNGKKFAGFGAEILNLGAAILNLFMLLVYFVLYIYFFHFGIYHTVYIINQMCSHKYLNLQLVKGNSNLPVFRWLTRTHGYLASHSTLCSSSFACLCLWSQ